MSLDQLVQQFGLPTAIAVFFIWKDFQTQKEHKTDLKEIVFKAIQAIDKASDKMEESNKIIADNNEIIQLLRSGRNGAV